MLAIVEYDGTDFAGFQLQAKKVAEPRTVQGELETALSLCTGERVRVFASSRTDTGVHARGQAVHFDSEADIAATPDRLARAVNANLPEDVKMRALRRVAPMFHSRYSATSRRYCYRVVSSRSPSPVRRRFVHHVRAPLTVEYMSQASQHFVGMHDFVAFTAEEARGKSTVRRVYAAEVRLAQSWQTWGADPTIWHTFEDTAQLIEIEVEASGFLRHMMRRIAGTLIRVGNGRMAPDDVASVLASRDKSLAGPTAPARGLCLESVTYPDEEMRYPQ
ncbi:MAG: tRNA pseudouridine(38-40) synthase TruA [Chloroflexota bacterium]